MFADSPERGRRVNGPRENSTQPAQDEVERPGLLIRSQAGRTTARKLEADETERKRIKPAKSPRNRRDIRGDSCDNQGDGCRRSGVQVR